MKAECRNCVKWEKTHKIAGLCSEPTPPKERVEKSEGVRDALNSGTKYITFSSAWCDCFIERTGNER